MSAPSRSSLTSDQLDELQGFLKDWLRHTGRTQADLRRALQASSIRMPVLLEVLQRTYSRSGLDGLAQQLCGIEDLWQQEDGWSVGGETAAGLAPIRAGLDESLGQLDLLLEEIRMEQGS
jgi:hypothetical protein